MTSADIRGAVPRQADTTAAHRHADRIREAARTERYWMLAPSGSGGTWALQRLDDTTGHLGKPEHVSEPLTESPTSWATEVLGITGWQPTSVCGGGYIEPAYLAVRAVAKYPRPGRSIVARIEAAEDSSANSCMVVYERWDATGRLSDPLYRLDRSGSDEEMLAAISANFGLTGQWHAGPHGTWRHG